MGYVEVARLQGWYRDAAQAIEGQDVQGLKLLREMSLTYDVVGIRLFIGNADGKPLYGIFIRGTEPDQKPKLVTRFTLENAVLAAQRARS